MRLKVYDTRKGLMLSAVKLEAFCLSTATTSTPDRSVTKSDVIEMKVLLIEVASESSDFILSKSIFENWRVMTSLFSFDGVPPVISYDEVTSVPFSLLYSVTKSGSREAILTTSSKVSVRIPSFISIVKLVSIGGVVSGGNDSTKNRVVVELTTFPAISSKAPDANEM